MGEQQNEYPRTLEEYKEEEIDIGFLFRSFKIEEDQFLPRIEQAKQDGDQEKLVKLLTNFQKRTQMFLEEIASKFPFYKEDITGLIERSRKRMQDVDEGDPWEV